MSEKLESALKSVRQRCGAILFVDAASRHLLVALFIVGGVGLVLRVGWGWEASRIAWLYSPLLLIPVISWLQVRKRLPRRDDLATWLDLQAGRTGLLVTLEETGDQVWRDRGDGLLQRSVALPSIDRRSASARVVIGVLFATLPFCVERWSSEIGKGPSYEAALERLAEKLETLEEVVTLDEERRAELRDDLEKLADEIAGVQPETAFEAIDRMEERIDRRAEEAREVAREASAELARAAEKADHAENPGESVALDEMRATLAKLDEQGLIDAASDLSELGLSEWSPDSNAPSSELADSATELSKELLELLQEKMAQLGDAGLLTSSDFDLAAAEFDPDALAALLAGEPGELGEKKPATCDDPDCDHGAG